uniref:peptidylprolyl isomerase n=1 Tax=Araucaria cunninghamii TaxID=56994 RepID=A0A0D6R5X8_ARACU
MAMSALPVLRPVPRSTTPIPQEAVGKVKLNYHVNVRCNYKKLDNHVNVRCNYKKNITSHVFSIWENFPDRSLLWSHYKGNRLTINCAATSDTGSEEAQLTNLAINDRQLTVESREGGKIHVRVDVPGKDTQKTFDDILTSLASEAGPVPGFRRQKGGKTANVPKFVLLKMLGRSRVRNFVIQELISSTVEDYIKKEKLKVKDQLDTKESAEELDAAFEPGKDFSFSVAIELEEEEPVKEQEKEVETVS